MKSAKYQRRLYRDGVRIKDLHSLRLALKETDLAILTDRPVEENFCREKVGILRRDIENYILRDPRFLTALKPLAVELTAPDIVKKMSAAARGAGVGPMAAIAGAIAQSLGKELLKKGCREVIIENGGDIFLKIARPRLIGIYSGRSKVFNRLSLKITPGNTPLGVSTSSGTIGHSLSFGVADVAVVLARDAALADAAATAVANRVKCKADLEKALAFGRAVKGVTGIVIIFKKCLISWGDIVFAA